MATVSSSNTMSNFNQNKANSSDDTMTKTSSVINLTFLAFGRVNDGTLLGLHWHPSTAETDRSNTEETFKKILHAAKIRLRPGGRQKLMWGGSTVSVMINHPTGDLLYGVVANTYDYPERLTYQLLNEVADQLESGLTADKIGKRILTADKIDQATELSLTNFIDLGRLLHKYQDPIAIDKLAAVQAKTDKLKSLMQSNISNILQNTEHMEELQDDVESMENTAQEYKRKATDLKDYYWWKDLKMQILITVVIIVLVLFVLHLAGLPPFNGMPFGGRNNNNNNNPTNTRRLTESVRSLLGLSDSSESDYRISDSDSSGFASESRESTTNGMIALLDSDSPDKVFQPGPGLNLLFI